MILGKICSWCGNIYFKTIVTSMALAYLFKLSMVSIFPLLIATLVYYFYKVNASCEIQRAAKWCGLLFALFLAFGEPNLLLTTKRNALKIIISLVGLSCFLSVLLQNFYDMYDEYFSASGKNPPGHIDGRVPVISFCFLFICWLPYWLAHYPAILTPDSISQIKQLLGLAPLVNHHPIAHTVTIKMLYELINFCGIEEINAVVGIISFMQLLFMALCFTFVIRFIYLRTQDKRLVYLTLFYYGIISVHGYYSVTIWKDIIHGAITVLLVMALAKILSMPECETRENIFLYLVFFILCCAFCLFRSNGYYALLLWAPILVLFSYKFKRYCLSLVVLAAILLSSYIKGPFYGSLGIQNAKFSESLSIPLQQIAYVVKNNRPLTAQQKYLLEKIIDVNRIPKLYKPYISDPIKGNCRNGEFFAANKWEYFKMWASLGIKYPKDYLIAWLHQTRGYWYPNIKYWVYGRGVKKNDIGLVQTSLGMNKVVDKLSLEKVFGFGVFYNVAIYTWVMLAMFFYAGARKNCDAVLCYLLLCGVFVSLLLGTPVFAEFRYYYSIVASLPLIIILPVIFKTKR